MEGYLALASHLPKVIPYELPQIIAQIPPPPLNVPMPIRKALATEGENKTIHYLLHGEYELTNTSWSRLQQKYVSCNMVYTALNGKGRPGGSQYQKKRKRSSKQENIDDVQVTPLSTDDTIRKFLISPACQQNPHACQAKLKFERYCLEIQYVYKVFHAIYKKFLTAIDHIDYHPLQQHNRNTTRVKRSDMYTLYGQYHSQTRELTPSEEIFLDTFLKVLYRINPTLHNNLARMKRTGIFIWLLGWGIFSNARSISKIKDTLHILQRQNQLQDKQIKQLAKYLNLTMHQVDRNSEMLYEMDTKVFIINSTLQHVMWYF